MFIILMIRFYLVSSETAALDAFPLHRQSLLRDRKYAVSISAEGVSKPFSDALQPLRFRNCTARLRGGSFFFRSTPKGGGIPICQGDTLKGSCIGKFPLDGRQILWKPGLRTNPFSPESWLKILFK